MAYVSSQPGGLCKSSSGATKGCVCTDADRKETVGRDEVRVRETCEWNGTGYTSITCKKRKIKVTCEAR